MIRTRRLLKLDKDNEIQVGSVVKFKLNRERHVGEVFSILTGSDPAVEIILYDKRMLPMYNLNNCFKIKKTRLSGCKLIDENFKCTLSDNYTIGDIVANKRLMKHRYGVIIGFHHPAGLSSTSYESGYNGTDMIDCVEIEKRGLRRKRNIDGSIRRFTVLPEKLKRCEVDLWNRTGPKIIHKL